MNTPKKISHFIKHIIDEDNKIGKYQGKVVTRFPPEPNGYLHIGHAKSICLNFGLALEYNGKCHLRMDDTNPEKEDEEYVESIKRDVEWLGFTWGEHLYHASDYFDQIYTFSLDLIKKGKAYVCDLSADELRDYRGSLTMGGKESPFRNRSVEENLSLFEKMKNGDFPEGSKTLRAKIDMNSPNINLRDPALYRIKKVHHQRTGNKWCIYPMYDFAHALSDALEGITHSICTLEFEDHRPLYDWFVNELHPQHKPQQIEFARLNIQYFVMSKRILLQLVKENRVNGWDDPRMPTISGLRRRGYTPESLRDFSRRIGVTKQDSTIEISELESALRDDLDKICPRVFAVINPIKVIITNFDSQQIQELDCKLHPKDDNFGSRKVPISQEVFIEADDFMENPPADYHRLSPGGFVRLRFAYILEFQKLVKNPDGSIQEIHCKYYPDSLHGKTPEGMKKVKGIINWVCAKSCIKVETRLYENLFTVENPLADKDKNFLDFFNPNSLQKRISYVEPSLANAKHYSKYQFERQGYFCLDPDSTPHQMIFNRTITLKDSFQKGK